ncbi:hypothetical protein VPH35_022391 [Triticum aestivum]
MPPTLFCAARWSQTMSPCLPLALLTIAVNPVMRPWLISQSYYTFPPPGSSCSGPSLHLEGLGAVVTLMNNTPIRDHSDLGEEIKRINNPWWFSSSSAQLQSATMMTSSQGSY